MTIKEQFRLKLTVLQIKLLHWEYWHSAVIYLPVMPYMFVLWAKARSFFFYNAANPGIKNGGFLMESKWEMHNDAPEGFFPLTLSPLPSENFELFYERVSSQISFPLIAKPATGCKGMGVSLISNKAHLKKYFDGCPFAFIVQEKIHYPMEAGIFYVKEPGQPKGSITGIVEKQYIHVIGNGRSSVYELLLKNPRYVLQLDSLRQLISSETMQTVLEKNAIKVLVDIGNHARGAYFINANHKINGALCETIDRICQRFPGFNYGRLDIRFDNWTSLEKGEQFAIIELNGSGSEPTHIYDPANSIWYAWKEICRHWKSLCQISIHNHINKMPYLSFKEGIQMLRDDHAHNKKMKKFDWMSIGNE